MEEKLVQLQRAGLCDQRVCVAISNLIEDLIWELPLAASKIVDIEREDKYTLAKFRVFEQGAETPEAGKTSLRGGEGQTDAQSLTRRRVKRNSLPKRENNAKKASAKRTSAKELAEKASAKIARLTQDPFTRLEQKYRDIKQEKDVQDAHLTRLEQEYVDVKQEKDAANQLIKLLQRRLEDSDKVLQKLQKEITESKRKDLEIYLLRDELHEAEKELKEYQDAEYQEVMEDKFDGIEIPIILPVQPSCERTASPELEFLSQTEINPSRNNPERSTLHHQVTSPVSQHPQVLPLRKRAADGPIESGSGAGKTRKNDKRRKPGKRLRPRKNISYEIKPLSFYDVLGEQEDY
ncbi:uncharacterized protein B0J16DRAFT_315666 [Fusarium flagelliforme]|uniref:uncharacterized protein n=1 Tax=Fusarium flagelliforme TaxID=2675880 RepID=UPI001E8E61CF|nr:uncharacterized protein B0J16DRAFT_315666 [Fusarium flagelliforme]KAH7191968.1 hypothetical protein B0J16DRAFT_315666 [Fusarium flagelliforme]